MLLIRCPYCQCERPEVEFNYGGQAHIERPGDPSTLSDDDWRDHLYIRTNPRGAHYERWRHTHGCGRFFNAIRDTVTDKFVTTYEAGKPRPVQADSEDVRS
ncbi:sarcosine oxidase subunit delta [Aureimonas sp. AU22]|jgi:sarcosine oxidase, subunit delta|uniref:sarcosine oxidase subunit delta n=1 Tax=Aureimonas sp. AU22 TaxID=1638162 RepID=UPI00070656F6|nr:sarcosine oxidase subunit delta [Aureimonas sp. AU22]BAT30235.1 sarcosine oxidase subunit delta [Aureimonas sp. AU22]